MTSLREVDNTFLSQTGLEVGTYGHIEVDDEGEAMEIGVIVGYDDEVEIVCTPWGVVVLDGYGEDPEDELGSEPGGSSDEESDADGWGSGRPMNTSAERYQATLRRYGRYATEIDDLDGDEASAAAAAAIAEMRAIDPEAWVDAAGYWPIIAGRMLAGDV